MLNPKPISVTLLLLAITTLTISSQIVADTSIPSQAGPQVRGQRQGNLTTEMKETLKVLINNSTTLYRRYRLGDMATYISQGMAKTFGDLWQVFIFGQGTEECSFSSNTIVGNQWAVWEEYGIYDLCYIIYRSRSCIKSDTPSYKEVSDAQLREQQQWGYSFSGPEQQRILALLDQASSYGGADMTVNAQYIISKIGPGGWTFTIGGPSNGIGMGTCYYRGYYAYIVDYTDLLWTYGIIRQY